MLHNAEREMITSSMNTRWASATYQQSKRASNHCTNVPCNELSFLDLSWHSITTKQRFGCLSIIIFRTGLLHFLFQICRLLFSISFRILPGSTASKTAKFFYYYLILMCMVNNSPCYCLLLNTAGMLVVINLDR